jgi:Transglutaminase-like superfamily
MLVLRAMVTLLAYDILGSTCRFETIYATVKRWRVADRVSDLDAIERVCKAVNYACIWYPKQARCLQRAFVITYLLRRKGVQGQMVMGAQKLPFKAHAWVEVDGRAVNERSNVQATYSIWDRCLCVEIAAIPTPNTRAAPLRRRSIRWTWGRSLRLTNRPSGYTDIPTNATIKQSAGPGSFQINSDILPTMAVLSARIFMKWVCQSKSALIPKQENRLSSLGDVLRASSGKPEILDVLRQFRVGLSQASHHLIIETDFGDIDLLCEQPDEAPKIPIFSRS